VDLVSGLPSDEALPLDGTVGSFQHEGREAAIAEDPAVLPVMVVGDGASEADTMGLADDMSLLIQAFVRDRLPPTEIHLRPLASRTRIPTFTSRCTG
jgi:hypothetical protein